MDELERTRPELKNPDEIEYDAETGTYHVPFESSTEPVCVAVISALAAVSNTDPMELDSLHSVVDPDALDTLVTPSPLHPSPHDVHGTFDFNGYKITVHSYGTIELQPLDERAAP